MSQRDTSYTTKQNVPDFTNHKSTSRTDLIAAVTQNLAATAVSQNLGGTEVVKEHVGNLRQHKEGADLFKSVKPAAKGDVPATTALSRLYKAVNSAIQPNTMFSIGTRRYC
ncbi:hypothetical protein A4A49_65934 [Nicotiana attenuata]|uniref:Uncharacterized protein n=1 Tax=Nicotiana attenuata TaxID=49451 RepID=A0A314KXJ7_NICAT|nr:hypothetical protein A4A49_65934 [Nicotiana attenuata]